MAACEDVPVATQPAQRGLLPSWVKKMPSRKRGKDPVEMDIVLEEPHRRHLAGDPVEGHVRLVVTKTVPISDLSVYLHGYVAVNRSNGSIPDMVPDQALDMTSRSGKKEAKNGVIRLFQQHVSLCNNNHLYQKVYKFMFKVPFPKDRPYRLPSSLTFEKGSVSYLLTAALTRPADSPSKVPSVISDKCPVIFLEKVDVALQALLPPVTVYVEPRSRKGKKKSIPTPIPTPTTPSEPFFDLCQPQPVMGAVVQQVEVIYEDLTTVDHVARVGFNLPWQPPHSDQRSEVTVQSSFCAPSIAGRSTRSVESSLWGGSKVPSGIVPPMVGPGYPPEDRTITATLTLSKSGWLPGETIKIKSLVQHARPFHKPLGIFMTLCREARMATSTKPSCRGRDGDPHDRDDSWATLSNLSLSSNGQTCRYRKELAQSFTPVYIDPNTLSHTVSAEIQVPTDVFPTLDGLPSDVLSFMYFAEVLIDLGGRLSSQIQSVSPKAPIFSFVSARSVPTTHNNLQWDDSTWDTELLRRTRGVVAIKLPIFIGSMDSSQYRQGRGQQQQHQQQQQSPVNHEISYFSPYTPECRVDQFRAASIASTTRNFPSESVLREHQAQHPNFFHPHDASYGTSTHDSRPPEYMAASSSATNPAFTNEKETMRSAEAVLLPSQPPGATFAAASAAPSCPPAQAQPVSGENHEEPRDKQELERRRLMVESSAPEDIPNHSSGWERGGPSAPFLDDRDDGSGPSDWGTNGMPPEPLPRYER